MKLYRLKLTRTLANGVTGERTVGYFRTEADCENAIPEAKNNFNIREDCGKFSIQERDFETSGLLTSLTLKHPATKALLPKFAKADAALMQRCSQMFFLKAWTS